MKALEPCRAWLEFSTGEERTVELLPSMRGPIFESIRSNGDSFRTVSVDPELGTIIWDDRADLGPDVVCESNQPA